MIRLPALDAAPSGRGWYESVSSRDEYVVRPLTRGALLVSDSTIAERHHPQPGRRAMTSQTSLTPSRAFVGRTVLAAALITLVATSAYAGAACETQVSSAKSDVPSVVVNYGDLNLATAEGNRVLYRRIVAAAAKVCPAITPPGSRIASGDRSCMDEAISRAVNDTQSAQLAELLASRSRHVERS